jgi:mannose-6-phosphate isomerase-like protein (cupin superfamily)
MNKPLFVKKAWGSEKWLVNEPEYCAKILCINPGFRCSLHYHKIKKETFIVQSGVVRLEQRGVRGEEIDETLIEGDTRTIMPKTPHRFSSFNGATILEISTHHDDADVVRLTDSGKI